VEILLGKDVAYRDSFVTRAETAQNGGTASARDGLLIDFVPESSPDLSKAKRMAYGLSLIADSGAYFAVGHKVRNPFEGMAVHREISNPTVQYGSPFPAYVCWRNTDNVKGKPDAVVQVTFSKATPAQIAAQRTKPNNAVHEESPWANAKT
jgi:hypothetical protein